MVGGLAVGRPHGEGREAAVWPELYANKRVGFVGAGAGILPGGNDAVVASVADEIEQGNLDLEAGLGG